MRKTNAGHRNKKPRRNIQERQRLVELWRRSGQPRSEFCVANNITLGSFSRWLGEGPAPKPAGSVVDLAETPPKTPPPLPAPFVELEIQDAQDEVEAERQPDLIVRCHGATRIEFFGGAADAFMERVVAMMKEGPEC